MTDTDVSCGTFPYHGDTDTIGARWSLWFKRFRLFLLAKRITEVEEVRANFLLLIGQEVYAIYEAIKPAEQDGTVTTELNEKLFKLMTDHFTAERSELAEQSVFSRAVRESGESVDEYYIRLRMLAMNCSFGINLEKELLRQFISHCNMEEFQRMAVRRSRTTPWTLEQALKEAKAFERTNQDLHDLRSAVGASRSKTVCYTGAKQGYKHNQGPERRPNATECGQCGKAAHQKREDCPALNGKCSGCGKTGHWRKKCRNPNKNATSNHRANVPQYGQPRQTVAHVEPEKKEFKLSSEEYSEFLRYKACRDLGGGFTGHVQPMSNGPRGEIGLCGTTLSMLIDTGSPINVIDVGDYHSLPNKPKLVPCGTNWYPFMSGQKLPIIGQFSTNVSYRNRVTMATYLVVEGQAERLLSVNTSVQLGLVKLDEGVLFNVQAESEQMPNVPYSESDAECETNIHAAFATMFDGTLGCIKHYEVELDVDPNVKTVRQPQRQVAIHLQEPAGRELDRQEEMGIIEKVEFNSGEHKWISNLVVIPKAKDAVTGEVTEVRITCDCRPINKAIRRIKFPGRSIEDLMTETVGAKWFAKLDLTKAFHQLRISEKSRNFTTITTHKGLYRYLRLHMGIASAAEIFTEILRRILQGLKRVLNMVDDVFILGETRLELHQNLIRCLFRLRQYGVSLNKAKCQFYKQELTFYGLTFTVHGVSPTEDRVRALREAKAPANAAELRSFLGAVQWCSRFIEDLCTTTEPLWSLTKKDNKWEWNEVHQAAFNKLKKAITNRCLAFFDKSWQTEVVVDASPVGLSAILRQSEPKDQTNRKYVCFASRLLSDTERRYSQCEKEALAAVWGCERFWYYLFGKPFILYTDNRAVQLIFGNAATRPPARIERWALRLTQFDYKIEHVAGKDNIADFFSRQPDEKESLDEMNGKETEQFIYHIIREARTPAISMQELVEETANDDELTMLKEFITNPKPKAPTEIADFAKVVDELSLSEEGIVLRQQQIVVPKSLRQRVIDLAHQGHQGIVKTKALIRSRVWFPGIDRMVEKRVSECIPCQATTKTEHFQPMVPSDMPKGPWEKVDGDFFGPTPENWYYFVNYDEYSRFPTVNAIRSTSFETVQPVLDELFSLFGAPVVYKTDNGPPFNSYLFADFAKKWGFKHRKVTPLWPRANGEVERFMKNMGKALQTAKVENKSMHAAIQTFLRVYRETPHSSTQVPPAILMLGRSNTTGIPRLIPKQSEVEAMHAKAAQNDQLAKDRMKREYDNRMRVRECPVTIGSMVKMKNQRVNKSSPINDPEPYIVTEINGTMITARKRDGTTKTRNASFFSPYHTSYFDEGERVVTHSNDSQRPALAQSGQAMEQGGGRTTNASEPTSPEFGTPSLEWSQRDDMVESSTIAVQRGTVIPVLVETPRNADKQRGRPKLQQSILNAQAREEELRRKRELNPPARTSSRLASKQSSQSGGKM